MLPQRRGGTQCSGCCAGPLGPGVFAPSQSRYDRRPKSKLPAPGLACDADPPARRSLAQRRLPWAVRDCSLAHRVTVSLPQARGCPPQGREVVPLPCHVPWSPRAPPCAEGNPPPGPASQRDSADNPSTPRGERMSPEAHCACSRRKPRPAPGSRSPRGPGPLSSHLRSYLACFLLS